MKKTIILTTIVLTLTTILSGCGNIPYRIEVDQGNIIEQKTLNRIRVGMSKQQVQSLLGTPLLQDVFHDNRWDYIQRYNNAKTLKIDESKVSLLFSNGLLSKIEKNGYSKIQTEPVPYSAEPK